MNLHQFRFVQEAVRRDLNLTETAKALFTSQPGVSKAILELEGELGVDIFARHGKRLRRVTEPGREVLKSIEVIMREVGNLKKIGDEFSKQDAGTLSIATTHSQARYFLPAPIAQMRKRFPKVNISLHQGTPEQVAKMVYEEVADFGLATESLDDFADLVTLPCYAWQHVLVLPVGHPLAQVDRVSIEDLAPLALISYHPAFSGRKRVDQAFATQEARAERRPRGDRRRRHQDLRSPRPGHRHRRRDRDARGRPGVRPDLAAGRPPVRPEHHAHRLQARRVPAQLRLRVRRDDLRPADPPARRARDGRRRGRLPTMTVASQSRPATGAVRTPEVPSRLPDVGTTIFTVMSALAQERGAVNLGQGFPDFDCDPALLDAVDAAMRAGLNQYPPMAGVPILRERIAAKIEALYGHRYDPASEITVTAGATQAILTAVLAFVGPGDEVIVLDPCYDSYAPNVALAGGRTVHVPLVPATFAPDFDRIAAALGPKTRALIVNSPHNPSGTVWSADDMRRLAELLRPTDVVVISDEVYEHMSYDGRAPERGALSRARGARRSSSRASARLTT